MFDLTVLFSCNEILFEIQPPPRAGNAEDVDNAKQILVSPPGLPFFLPGVADPDPTFKKLCFYLPDKPDPELDPNPTIQKKTDQAVQKVKMEPKKKLNPDTTLHKIVFYLTM